MLKKEWIWAAAGVVALALASLGYQSPAARHDELKTDFWQFKAATTQKLGDHEVYFAEVKTGMKSLEDAVYDLSDDVRRRDGLPPRPRKRR